jgi:hypothetical protein
VAHRTVRCRGAPPDSYCSLSGAGLPSKSGIVNRCSSGPVGAPDTVRCTPDSPVPRADRWSCHASPQISRPTVGAGDGWLTGQSGAPPDSPVNFSRTPLILFPRAASSHGPAWRTRHCPVHHRTVQCARPNWNLAAHSQVFCNSILFFLVLFIALR